MNFNPRFNIDECPPRILHSPTPPSLPQTKFLSTLETPKVLTSLEHCFHQNTSSPFPPFLEILNQPFFPTSVQEPSSRHHQPPALRKPENIQKPIDPPLPSPPILTIPSKSSLSKSSTTKPTNETCCVSPFSIHGRNFIRGGTCPFKRTPNSHSKRKKEKKKNRKTGLHERFAIREGRRKRGQERKHSTLSANKPGFVVISFCGARVQSRCAQRTSLHVHRHSANEKHNLAHERNDEGRVCTRT